MKSIKLSIMPILTAIICFGITSCYDDGELRSQLADHEQRISTLETLCKKMNTNISSLQTIVDALQKNDYITSTAPITESGVEIGYSITFTSGKTITIFHGEDGADGKNGVDGSDGNDGADGHTPVVGVKQDADGIYYWTIDGEWLLDDAGNKIKAVGTDGKNGTDGVNGTDGKDGENGKDGIDGTNGADGITPQLKIEEDYWYVSYDNGATWQQLYKAVGEDGAAGADGDAFFQSVTQDEISVTFTLADGTVIVIPMAAKFDVSFNATETICFEAGETKDIPFIVTGTYSDVQVECLVEKDSWSASARMSSQTEGIVTVTAPAPVTAGKVLVFVSNGDGQVVMKALYFEEGVFTLAQDTCQIGCAGGSVSFELTTNMEYDVTIPETVQSWITYIPTKAARTDVLEFSIAENTEELLRTADVTLISSDTTRTLVLKIVQLAKTASDLSAAATANCYIVSGTGTYSFKTVKGNSDESVGDVASAEVLWESFGTGTAPSVGDLVSSVAYNDGKISFATSSSFKEGNAVIAAKDSDGTILWSWHIWLTDEPQSQVYYNNAGTMMDRNLGATSATAGDGASCGLLYQWGRKDPFLGGSSSWGTAVASISFPEPVSSTSEKGTIDYATENPTAFILNNSSNNEWYYTGNFSTDNTRWQSEKTIYDPCPAGWRVPDGDNSGIWATAGVGNLELYAEDFNKGYTFDICDGGAWYPASGCRSYYGGHLNNVANDGFYWSVAPSGYGANLLYFSYLVYVNPSSSNFRSNGFAVRCLQE